MSTTTFLRIASIITLLYFAGHTAGAPWTPDDAPASMAVIEGMKAHSMDVMGSVRTYWDFYFGFGVFGSIFMLMLTVVLWQLASIAKTDPLRVRPIVVIVFIAFVANTVLAWKYFFVIPLVMSALIAVCLLLAVVAAGRRTRLPVDAAT